MLCFLKIKKRVVNNDFYNVRFKTAFILFIYFIWLSYLIFFSQIWPYLKIIFLHTLFNFLYNNFVLRLFKHDHLFILVILRVFFFFSFSRKILPFFLPICPIKTFFIPELYPRFCPYIFYDYFFLKKILRLNIISLTRPYKIAFSLWCIISNFFFTHVHGIIWMTFLHFILKIWQT